MKGHHSQRGRSGEAQGRCQGVMVFTVWRGPTTADWRPGRHGPWRLRLDKLSRVVKSTFGLYARAVPGMHRAGPGERGGGSYGRRAVATAKWAAMQISGVGKGLTENIYNK